MAIALVLMEHDGGQVKGASLRAVTAAQCFCGDYVLLAAGHNLDSIGSDLAGLRAKKVLLADHASLANPLSDRYAVVVAQAVELTGASAVLGASSTFARDILPRAAALLDAPMISDVLSIDVIEGQTRYRRAMYAGNAIATVTTDSSRCVLSVRATAFAPAVSADDSTSPIARMDIDVGALPQNTQFVSAEHRTKQRPDLTEARVVVGGGRPLKDCDTFERLIGGLADAIGGSVGATRAAVDAEIAPNDFQIGQTGKIIAPDLYIAVGVSGSIQHVTGIKDSRIIVAINKDPDAPIFKIATFGVVGDLFQIVPELIAALQAIRAARGDSET